MKNQLGVIGAGYIGLFVGAHLIQNGAQLVFLGRKRFGDIIARDGLSIHNFFTLNPERVQWVNQGTELPELDVVIFTTKSQDTESTAKEIASSIGPGTIIISLQNGLSNKPILQKIFPKHQVLAGMVPYNVAQIGDTACFHQSTKGHIYLEKNQDPRIQNLSGPFIELVDNIEALQWGKLLRNLNNALNALSDRPLLEQLSIKNERKLLSIIVSEAINAMKMNDIHPKNTSSLPIGVFPQALKLPNFLFSLILKKEVQADPNARLSMWHDLELGRKTEIDYLNGEIVALSKKAGVNSPLNKKIVSLIKLAESGQLIEARSQYQSLVND